MPESFNPYDIKLMQPLLEKKARELASQWQFKPEVFELCLVRRLNRGVMALTPGHPVRIELLWLPDYVDISHSFKPAIDYLTAHLRSAFSSIKKFGMYQPLAVATHMYFKEEKKAGKAWTKKVLKGFDPDSLISKHRIVVTKTVSIQVLDTRTGTVVESTVSTTADHREAPFKMWSELSQIVFDKYPETVDVVDEPLVDQLSETPLLEAALAEVDVWPTQEWVGNFLPTQMTMVQ